MALMEPVLFLPSHANKPAVLRGSCRLTVKKKTKVRKINLCFSGDSQIEWLDGVFDTEMVADHTLTLFNSQCPFSGAGSCANRSSALHRLGLHRLMSGRRDPSHSYPPKLLRAFKSNRELACSRSRQGLKGNVFPPGSYEYPFELVLNPRLPESVHLKRANVSYQVEVCVERPGLWRHDIVHSQPITVIRCPTESSLDLTEPLYMARTWGSQFHYEVFVSAKAVALGHRLPVSMRLTPLSHMKCTKLQVYLTEDVKYKFGHPIVRDPRKRTLLFEAGDAPPKSYGSAATSRPGDLLSVRALTDHRPESTDGEALVTYSNFSDWLWGSFRSEPTDLEMNLQLPLCQMHGHGTEALPQMHCDISYKNAKVSHSVEFVIIVSSNAEVDHGDSPQNVRVTARFPLRLLPCFAQEESISVPAYSSTPTGNDLNTNMGRSYLCQFNECCDVDSKGTSGPESRQTASYLSDDSRPRAAGLDRKDRGLQPVHGHESRRTAADHLWQGEGAAAYL